MSGSKHILILKLHNDSVVLRVPCVKGVLQVFQELS